MICIEVHSLVNCKKARYADLAFALELTHCVLLLLVVENFGEKFDFDSCYKALFSEVGGPLISSVNR
jgi:hypothetical protein